MLADSRYTLQAVAKPVDARVEAVTYDLPARSGRALRVEGRRAPAVAVPRGRSSATRCGATWPRPRPDVELVPRRAVGCGRAASGIKEPAEVERIAAACAVADRALAALLPEIRPGVTEAELAWRLEIADADRRRRGLAFDVACLAGPEAALPHGSPGDRPVRAGQVLLFDFGAQVDGYRSDMTRTLFVGEPRPRDLAIYELVAARAGGRDRVLWRQSLAAGTVPERAGRRRGGPRRHRRGRPRASTSGTAPGHGIGLATHELPSLIARGVGGAAAEPDGLLASSPASTSTGETGVRIEDLVLFDAAGRPRRAPHPLPARGARRRLIA